MEWLPNDIFAQIFLYLDRDDIITLYSAYFGKGTYSGRIIPDVIWRYLMVDKYGIEPFDTEMIGMTVTDQFLTMSNSKRDKFINMVKIISMCDNINYIYDIMNDLQIASSLTCEALLQYFIKYHSVRFNTETDIYKVFIKINTKYMIGINNVFYYATKYASITLLEDIIIHYRHEWGVAGSFYINMLNVAIHNKKIASVNFLLSKLKNAPLDIQVFQILYESNKKSIYEEEIFKILYDKYSTQKERTLNTNITIISNYCLAALAVKFKKYDIVDNLIDHNWIEILSLIRCTNKYKDLDLYQYAIKKINPRTRYELLSRMYYSVQSWLSDETVRVLKFYLDSDIIKLHELIGIILLGGELNLVTDPITGETFSSFFDGNQITITQMENLYINVSNGITNVLSSFIQHSIINNDNDLEFYQKSLTEFMKHYLNSETISIDIIKACIHFKKPTALEIITNFIYMKNLLSPQLISEITDLRSSFSPKSIYYHILSDILPTP